MNANHTRFEHSLGVAHLAKTLCERIRQAQPALQTTAKDVLCVELAGLFHDLGHGPFSHVFEDFVKKELPKYLQRHPELIPMYQQQAWPSLPSNWKHEMTSLMMIDDALRHLGLAMDYEHLDAPLLQIGNGIAAESMRVFEEHNDDDDKKNPSNCKILTTRDFVFIQECIWGGPVPEIETRLGRKGLHGRLEPHKEWLYDIVSNRHSGLDVDKVDYFARDARRAIGGSGQIDRLMIEEAVVAWADCTNPQTCVQCRNARSVQQQQHLMICYPEKTVGAVMDFFKRRFQQHKNIYQHKTTDAASLMIKDIMCMADPYFRISAAPVVTNNNAKAEYDCLPMSRAMLDPRSHVRMKDSIIDQIEAEACKQPGTMAKCHRLIHRLWSRDLYKCAVSKILNVADDPIDRRIWNKNEREIIREMLSFQGVHHDENYHQNTRLVHLDEDDMIVYKFDMHHGLKDEDPLTRMRFLEKSQLHLIKNENVYNLPVARAVPQSTYASQLPRVLRETGIRVYCRNSSKCDLVSHVFSLWWLEIRSECSMTTLEEEDGNPMDRPMRPVMLSQQEESDCENHYNDWNGDDGAQFAAALPNTPPPPEASSGFSSVTPLLYRRPMR
jgi:HD superfamily phosphohydrolase